jgi:hypothetical protein
VKKVDMPNPAIPIWEGCDLRVAAAIQCFERRWRPSSGAKHSIRLIKELIDPALRAYSEEFPQSRVNYISAGREDATFSAIIRKQGFEKMRVALRLLVRLPSPLKRTETSVEKTLEQRTLETLIALMDACLRKTEKKAIIPGTPIRNGRQQGFWEQGFCKRCGNLTEYAAVLAGKKKDVDFHPGDNTDQPMTLRLSTKYCFKHRPLHNDPRNSDPLHKGEWNIKYQPAKRSAAKFEIELLRLTRQSCAPQLGRAQSGDKLVDAYIYLYVLKHGFRSGDEDELRNHARLLVDNKLTDQKKKMVILRFLGLSQQAIAPLVGVKSRQAVSKALGSIKSEFLKLPIPPRFARNFAYP